MGITPAFSRLSWISLSSEDLFAGAHYMGLPHLTTTLRPSLLGPNCLTHSVPRAADPTSIYLN